LKLPVSQAFISSLTGPCEGTSGTAGISNGTLCRKAKREGIACQYTVEGASTTIIEVTIHVEFRKSTPSCVKTTIGH